MSYVLHVLAKLLQVIDNENDNDNEIFFIAKWYIANHQ